MLGFQGWRARRKGYFHEVEGSMILNKKRVRVSAMSEHEQDTLVKD